MGSCRQETVHIRRLGLSRAIAATIAILLLGLGGSVGLASPAAADDVRNIRFPVYGKVSYTDDFGAPRAQGPHEGNDLMGSKLMPLLAARDATVKWIRVEDRGNLLILRDADGWEYWYIHINNDTPGTDDGDSGDAETTAPHLHFEIHRPDGVAIDPYQSLQNASHGGMDPAKSGPNAPLGAVDSVTGSNGVVVVKGWAFDPNIAGPSTVLFYVDGRLAGTLAAGQARPDVGAAFPAAGPNHGYTAYLTPPAGQHRVCAYALNDGAGGSPGIGCGTVDAGAGQTPTTTVARGSIPRGNVDGLNAGAGRARIVGWALDPDTTAPIDVHVYVDGQLAGITSAAGQRADVGAAFPGMGSAHGFALSVPVSYGHHSVCAYAIDDSHTLANPLLGCRNT
jgi:hypothetical protein